MTRIRDGPSLIYINMTQLSLSCRLLAKTFVSPELTFIMSWGFRRSCRPDHLCHISKTTTPAMIYLLKRQPKQEVVSITFSVPHQVSIVFVVLLPKISTKNSTVFFIWCKDDHFRNQTVIHSTKTDDRCVKLRVSWHIFLEFMLLVLLAYTTIHY